MSSIQYLRDQGVESIFESAKQIATKIGVESEFPSKRKRKLRKMNSDEATDDGYLFSPEQDFQQECNVVFDSIINQLHWRFEAMDEVSADFEFLSGNSLIEQSVDQAKKSASNLAQKYNKDLFLCEFVSEIVSFKFQAKSLVGVKNLKKMNPLEILQLIHSYSLTEAYSNIEIALRIFLTIPVTVASCERSFSKLKIKFQI